MEQILWTKPHVQVEYVRSCKQQCKASEDRTHCVSCLRTMEEITECGIKARKTQEDTHR